MVKDVSLEIIQKCLNRCLHCSSCSTEVSTAILRLPDIRRIITGLCDLKVERICLSGGEPLLHPDIVEIVKEIADHHIIADIFSCGIVEDKGTHAPLPMELLHALKAAGLKTLLFNVPSPHEDIYHFITQSTNHFQLLQKSIDNAIACGIQAEIHFVPMRLNIQDVDAIIAFAERTGIQQVSFLKLVPHGRARNNLEQLILDDAAAADLKSRLAALKGAGKSIRIGVPLSTNGSAPSCHAVREKLYIRFDGAVFGCEAFKYITFQGGDGAPVVPDSIFERNIREIYQESEYLMRSLQLVNRYETCGAGCENCPVQKFIKERIGSYGL